MLIKLYCFSQDKSFKSFSYEDGISNNYVETFFEDSRGFIWIGTRDGLNRYDGHSFKKINLPSPSGEYNSGKPDLILSINEDNNNNLWIGTGACVHKYNYINNKFTTYSSNADKKEYEIDNIYEDILITNNLILFATRAGLKQYDSKLDSLIDFVLFNDISPIYISSLEEDENKNIWVGTYNKGVFFINTQLNTKTHFLNTSNNKELSIIRKVFKDSKNNIWFVSQNNGIFIKRNQSNSISPILEDELKSHPSFFTATSSINEDNNGDIWISSHQGGVLTYSPSTKAVFYYTDALPSPNNICGKSIKTIYKDSHNNMWIGSHGNGFNLFSPFTSKVEYYTKKLNSNSIPGSIVSCFEENADGKIWIGTDGGGLSLFNPQTKEFKNFTIKDGLKSNAILDIENIDENRIAIACWNGGLHILNVNTFNITSFNYTVPDPQNDIQNIFGLYYNKNTKQLWCNTYGRGTQIFDLSKMSFINEQELVKKFPFWNKTMYTNKILFDSKGDSWIIDGIRLEHISQNKSRFYGITNSEDTCNDGHMCTDIIETHDNKILITKSNGIRSYNNKTGCLEPIFNDSLLITKAKAILEDENNSIWITTENSLFKIENNTIQNISSHWGMPFVQFNNRAIFKSSQGELYLGTLNGFIRFNPQNFFSEKITPPLYITNLFINNIEQSSISSKILSQDIIHTKEITLNYDENTIGISFAALNYVDNKKSICKYKLENFDSEWITAGKERKATYTNLSPGVYTFKAITNSSENVWNSPTTELKITILPPWWQTILFKIALIILIILLIILFIIIRDRRIHNKKKELQKLITQRTAELKNANDTLINQKSTIEKSYKNLSEKQMLLDLKNDELQEALTTREKLIQVIAHDFKNPLNTLIGFTHLLNKKIKQKGYSDLESNIASLTNSSETLYNQMIELLEWSSSQNENINWQPQDINIVTLLNDTISLLSESITQKNINLSTDIKINTNAYVDVRMMSAVFRNLIINAIKYNEKGGKINIVAKNIKACITIRIEDCGVGLTTEQQDNIFSQIHKNDFSSGFGLQISSSFISKNKGKLYIDKTYTNGNCFIIEIPIGTKLEEETIKKSNYKAFTKKKEEIKTNATILIVDDNFEITDFLFETFHSIFNVEIANDGKEGVEKALRILPSLIISDVSMPVMTGHELCTTLKNNKLTSHIPIILLSAFKLPQEQIEGFLNGADDYVVKPFNVDVLKQKVVASIENRKLLVKNLQEKLVSNDAYTIPDSFEDKLIKQVTEVIYKNLNRPELKIEMIAREVGLSRSQLYRKTVAVIGQSPNEYLKTIRLQKAAELLRLGKYRVAEVAYEVGFSDPAYFSSCFIEKYGIKPSEFKS